MESARLYDCHDCEKSFDCRKSGDLEDCRFCLECRDCFSCYGLVGDINRHRVIRALEVPAVDNLDIRVYEAVKSDPWALNMKSWHCGTGHCRAGWIVQLAGRPGRKLENEFDYSTPMAAMLIYHKSTGRHIEPYKLYTTKANAMASIERAAKRAKAANPRKS